MKNNVAAALILSMGAALTANAQSFGTNQDNEWKKWRITGSVQSDVLVPQDDDVIGTEPTDNWALTNTYVQLGAVNKYIEAGARLEFTEYPLPGFEKDFQGWGVPFYYVKGNYKGFELTGGTFYDQFGSGLIFRTYEERSLGVDNSLRGGRLVIDALKGVRIKALAGQQRRYWETNPAWIYGADAEISLHDYFPKMQERNTALTLGASWVTKHEKATPIVGTTPYEKMETAYDEHGNVIMTTDDEGNDVPMEVPVSYLPTYNPPANVGAFDLRANLRKGNYNFLFEYAQKSQDPSYPNGYIYHTGKALLLSASYSKRGMSFQAQAKRSEDMSFRSMRNRKDGYDILSSSTINHLPAFTAQQTYALATIYPYATQNVPGEWAFQAEGAYTFKKKTPLGGKYGTTIKASFSHIRAIRGVADYYTALKSDDAELNSSLMGTNGFTSEVWKLPQPEDEKYYQEFTFDFEKKLSKSFKLNLKYLNQHANNLIIKQETDHEGNKMFIANIAIAEAKWNINKKMALRAEAQYLHTNQDQKDWYFGLLEFSLLPRFMFTVSDQFNAHVRDANGEEHKVHYYQALVTFTQKAHRLSVGYGKTRAGYNCSGGVCRYVPAQKGLTASYTFNW